MKNCLENDLIALFQTPPDLTCDTIENMFEVKFSFKFIIQKDPSLHLLEELYTKISVRDCLHISVSQFEEVVRNISLTRDSLAHFSNYWIEIKKDVVEDEEIDLVITVTKNVIDNYLSIYNIDKFVCWINSLSIQFALDALQRKFQDTLPIVFELQQEKETNIQTETISFISKGKKVIFNDSICEIREVQNEQASTVSYSNLFAFYKYIPQDFRIFTREVSHEGIEIFLNKLCILYSIIYLFDSTNIMDDSLGYRLNGYKPLSNKINLADIDYNKLHNIYYGIYKWVYNGGNLIDKIGIARNIISLNIKNNQLQIDASTIQAIQSSFIIYQQENVKQYIDIRNQISAQLLSLQNKADEIVKGYLDSYKKSSLAITSFFISIIIMQVVSGQGFTGLFTTNIILLSFGFLIVSLVALFFSYNELSKQIKRYDNNYHNMKKRHEDLLHKSDISRILNNDADFKDNTRYIRERRRSYTQLWVFTVFTLSFTICSIFIYNQYNSLYVNELKNNLLIAIPYFSIALCYFFAIIFITLLHLKEKSNDL